MPLCDSVSASVHGHLNLILLMAFTDATCAARFAVSQHFSVSPSTLILDIYLKKTSIVTMPIRKLIIL